jgi:hypothetical protein
MVYMNDEWRTWLCGVYGNVDTVWSSVDSTLLAVFLLTSLYSNNHKHNHRSTRSICGSSFGTANLDSASHAGTLRLCLQNLHNSPIRYQDERQSQSAYKDVIPGKSSPCLTVQR